MNYSVKTKRIKRKVSSDLDRLLNSFLERNWVFKDSLDPLLERFSSWENYLNSFKGYIFWLNL